MACKKAIKQRLYDIAYARSMDAMGNSLEIANKKADALNKRYYNGYPVIKYNLEGDFLEPHIDIPDSLVDAYYEVETKREIAEARKHEDAQKREGNWNVNEEGDITTFEQRDNAIKYALRSINIITSNLDKIKKWENTKGLTQDTLFKKIGELGVPRNQLELLKESEGNTIEEKLISFVANYSFNVEINTAKAEAYDFDNRIYYTDSTEGGYDVINEITGEKINYKTTEEAQNKVRELQVIPTQYYSNLTVPGGTNYTENEISTPLITPSIKGHAQFSTDNGIGWFRSDDRDSQQAVDNFIESGEADQETLEAMRFNVDDTKTRRILEVQSDLFQKGRDKKNLITSLDDKTGYGGNQATAQEYRNTIGGNENQFLQLLNKDNNWVTFFIKSIIQDSAKKGYEKVLFPSGNTASKVEGHTTLEEFKKQKEDRLQKINNDLDSLTNEYGLPEGQKYFYSDAEYIVFKDGKLIEHKFNSSNYQYIDVEINKDRLEAIKNFSGNKGLDRNAINKLTIPGALRAEKKQLEQELERVEREGFGALKPIYNFYENTVANILKKQGYSPVLITDEYGNTWNEIEINEKRDLGPILLQRQSTFQMPTPELDFSVGITEDNSEQVRNEMYEKSKRAVQNFIDTFGISVEAVDRIPGDPVARVNVLSKVVEVVEGRADATTLPEEAAHILVAMLRGSNIYRQMMSDIQGFEVYAEVLRDYSDYTPEQQLEEAAGKLIGRLIGYRVDPSIPIPQEIQTARSWWQKILDYIRNLFSRQPDKLQNFEKLANQILIGEFSSDIMDISEDSFLYFESRGNSNVQRRTINKLNKTTNEVKLPSGSTRYIHTPSGKEIRFRVSDIVKRIGKNLFGTREFKDDQDKNIYLNKATVIHLYNQLIVNMLSDGTLTPSDGISALTSVQKEQLLNEVMGALKTHPQFQEAMFQDKAFYDLGNYLNTLYRGVSDIYNNVIAKDANAVFLTEQIIYSPTRDLAGTVDLMVVYSDGRIAMYDYKTTQLKKDRFNKYVPIDDKKRQLYEVQLSEYKDILVREYGVNRETGFAESRVIPIHVDYTRDPKTGRLNGGLNKGSGEGLLMDAPGVSAKLREAVKQLTVAGELTGDRDADVLIQKLYNQKGTIRERIKRAKGDEKKRLEQRLNNIQKTIDSVILNETIVPVLKSLEAIVDDVTSNAASLSYAKLLEYKELLDIYGDFNTDFRKYIKTDQDRDNVAFFNNKMEEASKLVVQTIVDRHIQESGDNDLLNAGKPKSFLGGLFDGIIHWANPVLKRLGDLVSNARERARMASKKASETIKKSTKEYLDWAKQNGMSGVKAFDIFFNENTGNLVTEFNKKFYEDKEIYSDIILKKDYRRLTEAVEWFETWYHFDYEKHAESVARYEKILDENPDLTDAEKLRQISWVKDSTPQNNPIYWVKNSGFVRPNTFGLDTLKNSGYVNEKWLYIQQNQAAKQFYDMYTTYNREFAQLIGYDMISPNFVANIRADMIDNIARMGVGALGMTKTEIIRSMEVYEYDEVYGAATNADGTPIQSVPLLYLHELKSPLSAKEKSKIEEDLKSKYDPDSVEYREAVDYEIWKAEKQKGIESKSRDLGSSLILMADAVYKYAYMNDVKDTALSLREILKVQKEQTVDKYGRSLLDRISRRVATRFGVNQDTLTAFDKFLNYHVFGQTLQSTDATMEFGNDENPDGKVTISGAKALRSLMTIQSVISIALSPVISTANFLQAKASTIVNGKKGMYYNSENLKEAVRKYGKRDLKAVGLIYLLEPAAKNRRQHDALKTSASALVRAFNLETMFSLQRGINTSKIADKWGIEMPAFGDENIDNIILLAMAENYVLDSDGQLRSKSSATNPPRDPNAKSIMELVEVNGDTQEVSLEAIGQANITRFRRMVQEAASEIKGSATADQQNQINFSILGQVLTHFRNWLPHLARERFGGLRYNETMGEVQVGRYSVAMGEILSFAEKDIVSNVKSTIKDLALMGVEIGTFGLSNKLGLGKKINKSVARLKLMEFNEKYPNNPLADPDLDPEVALDRFVELRKRQLKAFLTEAQIVFGFLLLISALKSLDWDDEEEVGILANMSYKMLKRSYLELSFFLSPSSVDQIIKSPVALWSLARQMGRVVSNANQETLEMVGLLEENKRDRTPLFYHTSKMIPGVNQVLNLMAYFPQTEETSILDKMLFERVFK